MFTKDKSPLKQITHSVNNLKSAATKESTSNKTNVKFRAKQTTDQNNNIIDYYELNDSLDSFEDTHQSKTLSELIHSDSDNDEILISSQSTTGNERESYDDAFNDPLDESAYSNYSDNCFDNSSNDNCESDSELNNLEKEFFDGRFFCNSFLFS